MKANNLQRKSGDPRSPTLCPGWWRRWKYCWQIDDQPVAELLHKVLVNWLQTGIGSRFSAVASVWATVEQRNDSKHWFTWMFLCNHLLLFRNGKSCETLEPLFSSQICARWVGEEPPTEACLLGNRKTCTCRLCVIFSLYLSFCLGW